LNCVSSYGTVIANIDDLWLASLCTPGDERLLAVAMRASHPFLVKHRQRGGMAAFIETGQAVMTCGDQVVTRRLPPASYRSDDAESGITWLLAFATAASCQFAELSISRRCVGV
jgi:hypothetical protein